MLSEHGGSWPCESKHPYCIHEFRHHRGPSTRGKGGRSLRVTPQGECKSGARWGPRSPGASTAEKDISLTATNEMGVPPALPGRQSNFENSGSIPPAVAFVLPKPVASRASCRCSCFCFSAVAIRPL